MFGSIHIIHLNIETSINGCYQIPVKKPILIATNRENIEAKMPKLVAYQEPKVGKNKYLLSFIYVYLYK